ncbi:MAG: hypothetical protein AAF191_00750 [Verrucomicrobiota bacterium]
MQKVPFGASPLTVGSAQSSLDIELPIQHIFVDIDGVLADFTASALRVHGRSEMIDQWPKGERDIPKVLGISRSQYWRAIEAEGSDFWRELEPYPWFRELIDLVQSTAPFSLLTAAPLAPSSVAGKVAWIDHHFPKVEGRRFRDFFIGSSKWLMAAPDRVLIDDAEMLVDRFSEAGGHGILFPQVWNRDHNAKDPLATVARRLAEVASHRDDTAS